MGRILVTGATGGLGGKTLELLLQHRPAGNLTGLVRDAAKATDLAAKGIEVRAGDYTDYASLVQAFQGVDTVMLISTHAFTDRETEHGNAIRAAQEAGVTRVVYNPIIQKPGSAFDLVRVTGPDRFTVDLLKSSGLQYTLVAQPPFLESFAFMLGDTTNGVRVPAGDGKAAGALRDELAEAQAVVLATRGHESKTYTLTGSPAVSFAEIASILSEVHGKEIPYVPTDAAEYLQETAAAGLPEPVAQFALGWSQGVNAGEWDAQTGDLRRLIGRAPLSIAEFLKRG